LRYEDMEPALRHSFELWCRDPVRNSPPAGEALQDVAVRTREGISRMTGGLTENMTVAAVTHGGIIRVAVSILLGVPLDVASRVQIDPASITVFQKVGGIWKLMLLNDTCHLK